jgi:hypothetical protein
MCILYILVLSYYNYLDISTFIHMICTLQYLSFDLYTLKSETKSSQCTWRKVFIFLIEKTRAKRAETKQKK